MSELSEYLTEPVDTGTSEETLETPAPAETVETPVEPDPVQEYVAKYGGDTEAALKAAVEAQSLIGRQGQELGTIRQELQGLKEALAPPVQEQQYVPVDDALVNWANEIAYSENWQQGAEWARVNQPALYETIMNGVYETNPKDASRYEMAQATSYQQSQLLNQIAPQIAPLVADAGRQQFMNAWQTLKPTFTDIDEMSAPMLEVAQSNPQLLAGLQNPNPDTQRETIANLYWIAKGKATTPLQGVVSAAAADQAAQAQQLRAAAAVGTATASAPQAPPSDEKPELSEWRSALNAELDQLSGRVTEIP